VTSKKGANTPAKIGFDIPDAQADKARRRVVRGRVAWLAALVITGVLVTVALVSARPVTQTTSTLATAFTMPTSDGRSVSLSDYAGKPVLLYFSEGAGCDACLIQMAAIEKDPEFAKQGIAILPIVMNTAAQINQERKRLGVVTPFALDNGTVSKEYKAIGTGMHADLPGHGFVLIDAKGVQRWTGNYPSMWIDPKDLLKIVDSKL
jgi:peroxiredoxin